MLRPRPALVLPLVLAACGAAPAATTPTKPAPSAPSAPPIAQVASPTLDHEVETLAGSKQKLSDYRGKALLLVNVASECGYTPQYAQLQELYGKYKDRGLVVLGFPSNDFGGQEPGDAAQIQSFVTSKFAVDFPMMAKIHAKGPEIAPLYQTLTEQTPEGIKGAVQWNFTKFLVDPSGKVVARFNSEVSPMDPSLLATLESTLPGPG